MLEKKKLLIENQIVRKSNDEIGLAIDIKQEKFSSQTKY